MSAVIFNLNFIGQSSNQHQSAMIKEPPSVDPASAVTFDGRTVRVYAIGRIQSMVVYGN